MPTGIDADKQSEINVINEEVAEVSQANLAKANQSDPSETDPTVDDVNSKHSNEYNYSNDPLNGKQLQIS